MRTKVAKLIPSEGDASKVGGVVLGDGGPTLPADFVIMGVGVGPATGFLKESGFELQKDGGVLVDEYLKVVGKEDVYAIGDITVFPQVETKEARRIEHWNVGPVRFFDRRQC